MPEPLIHGNAATYATLKAAIAQHARSSTSPRVAMIENVVNDQLIPDFEDDDLFVAYDNAVPADDEAEIRQRDADLRAVTVAAGYGCVFVNELRAVAGLDPIPGGDDALVMPPAATAEPEPSESSDEPEADDQPEQHDEPKADAKTLDFDLLLKVNDAVSKGSLPRAVAINVIAKAFSMADVDAKQFVGFRVSVPNANEITSEPEVEHEHDQEGLRDGIAGGQGEAGSAGGDFDQRD